MDFSKYYIFPKAIIPHKIFNFIEQMCINGEQLQFLSFLASAKRNVLIR